MAQLVQLGNEWINLDLVTRIFFSKGPADNLVCEVNFEKGHDRSLVGPPAEALKKYLEDTRR